MEERRGKTGEKKTDEKWGGGEWGLGKKEGMGGRFLRVGIKNLFIDKNILIKRGILGI